MWFLWSFMQFYKVKYRCILRNVVETMLICVFDHLNVAIFLSLDFCTFGYPIELRNKHYEVCTCAIYTVQWHYYGFYSRFMCAYTYLYLLIFFSHIYFCRFFLSIPLRFSTGTVMHSSAILRTIRWHYFYHVFASVESIFAFDSCCRCYAVIFETYMFRLTWMGHFPVVVLLSLFFLYRLSLIWYYIVAIFVVIACYSLNVSFPFWFVTVCVFFGCLLQHIIKCCLLEAIIVAQISFDEL